MSSKTTVGNVENTRIAAIAHGTNGVYAYEAKNLTKDEQTKNEIKSENWCFTGITCTDRAPMVVLPK